MAQAENSNGWPPPVAYLAGESFRTNIIVAVDCLDGQVAFDPPEVLEVTDANILFLSSIGYTPSQIGEMVSIGGKSVRNRLWEVRNTLDSPRSTAEMVAYNFKQGIMTTTRTPRPQPDFPLRQQQVWNRIAHGLSSVQVGNDLGLSKRSVEYDAETVLNKLDVSNRIVAALYRWMLHPIERQYKPDYIDESACAARGLQAAILCSMAKAAQPPQVPSRIQRSATV